MQADKINKLEEELAELTTSEKDDKEVTCVASSTCIYCQSLFC